MALIFRMTLNVEWIDQQHWETFEFCVWLIKSKGITSYIHRIYRSPNSDLNQFLDDIAEHLTLHVNTNYLIFVGDFNILWGDELDGNASLFADTLEALGLIQSVQFPMHNRNNILNLVSSKAITNNFICDVLPGLVKDFSHIDDIAEHLESQGDKALNEVAPKCEKLVHKRKKQPWYNTTIKEQKTVMRNREKIGRKYETPETWMAFDIEKIRYNTLLKQAKEESIKSKVLRVQK